MRATNRSDIAEVYINRVRDLMQGKRIMSEVRYEYHRPPDQVHASEIDDGTCPLQPYYHRTLPESEIPKQDDTSILFFLRGRVVERAIASECDVIEKDGILCRPDDFEATLGYAEVKSCWKDCGKFHPLNKDKGRYLGYPHWIQRIKTYMYAVDDLFYNLVVMFMLGNTWTTKWDSPKRVPCKLKAWQLEGERKEVDANWLTMLHRRDMLFKAVDNGISHLWESVERRLPPWGCGYCQFTQLCEYYSYQLKLGKNL